MDRAFLLYVRQGQFLRVIGTDATGLSPRIHSKAFKPVGKLKSRSGMPVAERFEEQCDAWPIGLGHLEGERTRVLNSTMAYQRFQPSHWQSMQPL